jgi:hypothetical protein
MASRPGQLILERLSSIVLSLIMSVIKCLRINDELIKRLHNASLCVESPTIYICGTRTGVEAVELPGDSRTMPVDKRAVIPSDLYLDSE